jgi:hypothetical protein
MLGLTQLSLPMRPVELAREAFVAAGLKPYDHVIRGGTDGSRSLISDWRFQISNFSLRRDFYRRDRVERFTLTGCDHQSHRRHVRAA